MSCVTAVHDFKDNHVKFAGFVLLAVSEEAKTMTSFFFVRSMYNNMHEKITRF